MDKVASSQILKNVCQGVSLRTWKLHLQPLLVNTSLLSGFVSKLKIMVSSEYSPLLDASPADKDRLQHLQQVLLSGGDTRLQIDPQTVIKFTPMGFFTRPHNNQMSQYQLSYILKLMLGLPLPAPDSASQNMYPCNLSFTPDGTHHLLQMVHMLQRMGCQGMDCRA